MFTSNKKEEKHYPINHMQNPKRMILEAEIKLLNKKISMLKEVISIIEETRQSNSIAKKVVSCQLSSLIDSLTSPKFIPFEKLSISHLEAPQKEIMNDFFRLHRLPNKNYTLKALLKYARGHLEICETQRLLKVTEFQHSKNVSYANLNHSTTFNTSSANSQNPQELLPPPAPRKRSNSF